MTQTNQVYGITLTSNLLNNYLKIIPDINKIIASIKDIFTIQPLLNLNNSKDKKLYDRCYTDLLREFRKTKKTSPAKEERLHLEYQAQCDAIDIKHNTGWYQDDIPDDFSGSNAKKIIALLIGSIACCGAYCLGEQTSNEKCNQLNNETLNIYNIIINDTTNNFNQRLQFRDDNIKDLEEKNKNLSSKISNKNDEINELNSTIETTQKQLNIYEERFLNFINSDKIIKTPTYEQVKEFIRNDKTKDEIYVTKEYDTKGYNCEAFTNDLIKNSTEHGFYACSITIYLKNSDENITGHAVVQFNTSDRGKIYIEPQTGDEINCEEGQKLHLGGKWQEIYYCTDCIG